MARILVIRFSALGDVAMSVPVVQSVAERYPMHEFIVLGSRLHAPLFERLPKNVCFKGVNLKEYAGLTGLFRLFREVQEYSIDAVADLHDVLRSKVLRFFFRCKGIPVAHVDKERSARRGLVRKDSKVLHPLKTSQERYADVFAQLHCPVNTNFYSIFGSKLPELPAEVQTVAGRHEGSVWIGVAPFARHQGKIYPLVSMERVLELLGREKDVKVFLFGFGQSEYDWCLHCEQRFPYVTSLVGKFDLRRELLLMSHLDVMVTMDSANMHLAALVHVPTVSIWGATHPYAGFLGFQTDDSQQVQMPMECRPCSIFGNKPCWKGTCACMNDISPDRIVSVLQKWTRKKIS